MYEKLHPEGSEEDEVGYDMYGSALTDATDAVYEEFSDIYYEREFEFSDFQFDGGETAEQPDPDEPRPARSDGKDFTMELTTDCTTEGVARWFELTLPCIRRGNPDLPIADLDYSNRLPPSLLSPGQPISPGQSIGRPMSCVPGYFEVTNTHTVGFLTIP